MKLNKNKHINKNKISVTVKKKTYLKKTKKSVAVSEIPKKVLLTKDKLTISMNEIRDLTQLKNNLFMVRVEGIDFRTVVNKKTNKESKVVKIDLVDYLGNVHQLGGWNNQALSIHKFFTELVGANTCILMQRKFPNNCGKIESQPISDYNQNKRPEVIEELKIVGYNDISLHLHFIQVTSWDAHQNHIDGNLIKHFKLWQEKATVEATQEMDFDSINLILPCVVSPTGSRAESFVYPTTSSSDSNSAGVAVKMEPNPTVSQTSSSSSSPESSSSNTASVAISTESNLITAAEEKLSADPSTSMNNPPAMETNMEGPLHRDVDNSNKRSSQDAAPKHRKK
jgi:hypothetical protein